MITIHFNIDIDLSNKSKIEIKEILGEISNMKNEDNHSEYSIETLSKKINSIFNQSANS